MTVAFRALLGAAGRDTGGGGSGGYRAYRLYITEDQGSNRCFVAEMWLWPEASGGGDDLVETVGGTAFGTMSNAAQPFDHDAGSEGAGDFSFTPPEILGWDFGEGNEQTVLSYAIKGSGTTNRPPKAWKLQGSKDTTTGLDGTWDDLDEQSNQSWTSNEVKTFDL